MTDIQEGDRFEELQPTGDAGALWQLVSIEDVEGRVHLFNVDDPAQIRAVQRERLLDEMYYRPVTTWYESEPEAA